jgi:NTE family protein
MKDYSNLKNLILEGAGAKGIAYGGALLALSKRGILQNIVNIAGTSAGSITAGAVALGADAEMVERLIIKETDFDAYMDKKFGLYTTTLLTSHSLFEGEVLDKDIKHKVAECLEYGLRKFNKADYSFLPPMANIGETITFAHLEKLHAIGPKVFKLLHVVGTNVTLKRPQIFNAKNTPDFPIWQAIRISIGLPLLFPPVWVDGCYYCDGGVAYNYPIDLFDEGDTPNPATLGIKLMIPKEIAAALVQYSAGRPRDLLLADATFDPLDPSAKEPVFFNFVSFVNGLVGYLTNQVNEGRLKRSDDLRTIYLSAGSVGTADFGLSLDKKEGLSASGGVWAENFFAAYDLCH